MFKSRSAAALHELRAAAAARTYPTDPAQYELLEECGAGVSGQQGDGGGEGRGGFGRGGRGRRKVCAAATAAAATCLGLIAAAYLGSARSRHSQ